MLRQRPVPHAPRVVAVRHPPGEVDPAARDLQEALQPPRLLQPVLREPRRQPVGVGAVAERVVHAGEPVLQPHGVARVGDVRGAPQLGLGDVQSLEAEVVEVRVVTDHAPAQVERDRLGSGPQTATL